MKDKELRELDAWIAEHVFGWTVMNETLCDPKLEVRGGRQTGDVDINPVASLPHYTTDPAAAMAVLEKCAEHIKSASVKIMRTPVGRKWCVWKSANAPREEEATADTLPLAIALFAQQLFKK